MIIHLLKILLSSLHVLKAFSLSSADCHTRDDGVTLRAMLDHPANYSIAAVQSVKMGSVAPSPGTGVK